MLTTITETQASELSERPSKNALFRKLHEDRRTSNKYLSAKVSSVMDTVGRTRPSNVQVVTSSFFLSDIKPKLKIQGLAPTQSKTANPNVKHLIENPIVNRQNPLDALRDEKEIIQRMLTELDQAREIKLAQLEEAKALRKLQGSELSEVKDVFADQKQKLITMIATLQAENEAIESKVNRVQQTVANLSETRDESAKIMQKYQREVQRLRENVHLLERKSQADLKLVAEKLRREEELNRKLREDLQRQQKIMNEDDRRRKEFYILQQENDNIELQIKQLQQQYEHHTKEYGDLQQEYDALLKQKREKEAREQSLISQARQQQEKAVQDKRQLLGTLQQDLEKLGLQIQRMKQDKQQTSIDAQVQELVSEGQRLQQEFTRIAENSRIKNEELHTKLKGMDAQQTTLSGRLNELTEIKEDAKRLQKANRERHDRELQDLRSQIEMGRDEIGRLESEAKKLIEEKDFYDKQIQGDQGQSLHTKLEAKGQIVESLKQQKEHLNSEIAELESELTELQERQEQLDEENPSPKHELDQQLKLKVEMERQYADMQQSIAALREQVRQNDESIEMNKMQYDKYASMAGDMDKREQQLRDKIKTLEDQYQVKLSKNKKKKR